MKLSLIAGLAAIASAHPTFDAQEFALLGDSEANAMMTFSAALPARNGPLLDQTLQVISDPDSPLYGKWLTQAEVESMTSPDPEVRAEVKQWVTSTGAKCVDMPSSLKCRASVAQVEGLLKTNVSKYSHTARNGRIVHRIHPGTAYEVPTELQGKLSFMTNLVDFPTVRMRLGKVSSHGKVQDGSDDNPAPSAPSLMTLPESLTTIYQLKGMVKNMKSTTAAAEFQADQSWAASDVATFAQENGIPDYNATNIIGPYSPASPDAEATLDFEYMGAVSSQYADQWYWTESDWMYEWTETLKKTPDSGIPRVFSVSWGWSETNQCYVDPSGPCAATPRLDQSQTYVNQTNQNFAAITARGVSILVSSGDSGAHGRTDGSCSSTKTNPDWPTSSPYVTAVGATMLQNPVAIPAPTTPYCKTPDSNGPCAGSGTEIVCSTATGALIVSGGGFSTFANMPTWQQSAVTGYLKQAGVKLPGNGNFNPKGRAYPDVAALGHNYLIWISGSDEAVDGTSCSSPVWGGLIATLNSARATAGKSSLGFLNPALYKLAAAYPAAFTDVTVGDNTCTEDGCTPGCTGYGAAKGWDAVTGFGTPVYPKLASAFASLP